MALPQTRKLALATATALALLTAGLAWQASAADGSGDGSGRPGSGGKGTVSDTVSGERVEHAPGAAGDHWTPERMRSAEPAPMPVLPGT
ncbi:hypothetical protein ABZ626_21215 [Streptomyces longispororuber]|uniref:hypothetical protein n=1 Tax=Streptomyces longispororuber TaxID=68230 RepID=UPI0033E4E2F3